MAASENSVPLPERVSCARIPDIRPMPELIQIQLDSFEWFRKEGLRELFAEISPIEDFTGKNLSLEFIVPPEPCGLLRSPGVRSKILTPLSLCLPAATSSEVFLSNKSLHKRSISFEKFYVFINICMHIILCMSNDKSLRRTWCVTC